MISMMDPKSYFHIDNHFEKRVGEHKSAQNFITH